MLILITTLSHCRGAKVCLAAAYSGLQVDAACEAPAVQYGERVGGGREPACYRSPYCTSGTHPQTAIVRISLIKSWQKIGTEKELLFSVPIFLSTLRYFFFCGNTYQTVQPCALTIASPVLQPKAAANSGIFITVPLQRNLPGGCGSVCTCKQSASGR